tara:strand:- start:7720 stop:7896 length:177 start_codon:yes stop_codon:yes gene_type:complete
MTSKEIIKKYLQSAEVAYVTSDNVVFLNKAFASSHALKNGLTIKKINKPKKKVKNGTK